MYLPVRLRHQITAVFNWADVSRPVLSVVNPLIAILKRRATDHHSNAVIGTLTVDGWAGCWYSPPRSLLAVPHVTAHPSTASVPTSCYSMWHYNCILVSKGLTECDAKKLLFAIIVLCWWRRSWTWVGSVSFLQCDVYVFTRDDVLRARC